MKVKVFVVCIVVGMIHLNIRNAAFNEPPRQQAALSELTAVGFAKTRPLVVEIEDALQNARRYYNAVVRDLNTRVQSFPDLIVASLFRFETRDFFELDSETERLAPQVDLGG